MRNATVIVSLRGKKKAWGRRESKGSNHGVTVGDFSLFKKAYDRGGGGKEGGEEGPGEQDVINPHTEGGKRSTID